MDYKEYAEKNGIDLTKEDLPFELGNIITQIRLTAGLSQEKLAEKMQTTQSSVSRAESGEVEPSVSFLKRAAEAAGLRLELPKLVTPPTEE